jgi:hypothetical protein
MKVWAEACAPVFCHGLSFAVFRRGKSSFQPESLPHLGLLLGRLVLFCVTLMEHV